MNYFDSHTHVQFAAYDEDRDSLIKKTLEEGVGMINVGTNLKTSKDAVSLANKYSDYPVFATVGLHPTHTYSDYQDSSEIKDGTGKEKEFNYDLYKSIASEEKVVAIGECGLDYFRLKKSEEEVKKLQKSALKEQIKLAKEFDLPLMVHCRPSSGSQDAYKDLIEIIKAESEELNDVIIHFFVGSKEIASEFIDLGFYFTFGGVITFARDYDDVIDYIPLDHILLETDAPYVTPEPHRGKRNEPRFVKEVYKKISELKNIDLKDLKSKIKKNNEKVFDIKLDQYEKI